MTRPDRIAAEGGSNGGLLIANMLVATGALRRTVLHDSADRHAPLLRLLAGASWVAEYGDPDDPADWAFIRRFSAYQGAEPAQPYPPILLATSRRDDRVHPGHARKRPSCSHSATTHISTNPQREAMVTAKTIWKWRPSPRSEWRSYSNGI